MCAMRLYLINPSNPLVRIVNVSESRWNLSYRNNSRVDCRTYADFQHQRRRFAGINRMQLQTEA